MAGSPESYRVVALCLAVALRPRFGRVDPHLEVLSRDRAPALFGLVDEVAAAVGAPAPHIVAVSADFNAYATAVGLRRRRVLCLGLPLWGALNPQERVALLGHELGHFVNGDVRRGLPTQPALTTLGTAADLIRPVESYAANESHVVILVGHLMAKPVQWVLSRLLLGLQLLLLWVGLRDSQRAEYLADEMAAAAAGSAATIGLAEALLAAGSVLTVVHREARAEQGPARWREAANEARTSAAERLPLLRQLSVRDDASLFASHPPVGLRVRMVEARQWRTPAVVLTEHRCEQIDAELAGDYQRVGRHLAWSD